MVAAACRVRALERVVVVTRCELDTVEHSGEFAEADRTYVLRVVVHIGGAEVRVRRLVIGRTARAV